MKLLLFYILLLISKLTYSCSCGTIEKITENEIKNVGEAFIGVIKKVDVNVSNSTLIATFEIKKHLKGDLQNLVIKVVTNISGASCGLNFKVGQKWYVFAHYSNDALHADLCGRSVQLSQVTAKSKRLFIGRKNYRKMKIRARQDKKAIIKYSK